MAGETNTFTLTLSGTTWNSIVQNEDGEGMISFANAIVNTADTLSGTLVDNAGTFLPCTWAMVRQSDTVIKLTALRNGSVTGTATYTLATDNLDHLDMYLTNLKSVEAIDMNAEITITIN